MKAKYWLGLVALCALLLQFGGGILPAAAEPPSAVTAGGASVARSTALLNGAIDATLARQPLTTPQDLGDGTLDGLQYADPTEQLALVDPPEANSQGNASLTYPLLIPPGRGGLQPDLNLQYDSSGSDGWVGMGWNLSVGEVAIDTRWGAPRYSTTEETETYTLEGEVLSPTAVRSTLLPRVAEREDFTRRVETAHDRIIRHGTSPKNYYWEVIDKTGGHRWYGGAPDFGGPFGDTGEPHPTSTRDASAILSDAQGNAYRWALSAERDVGVNVVRYFYETVLGQRVGGDRVAAGKQLYLKSIRYTEGSPVNTHPADPAYEVRFLRDGDITPTPAPRKDVVLDARNGVLEVTSDLLRRVEVYFGQPHADESARTYNILSRAYKLNYDDGAYGKSLLKSVDQIGSDGVTFGTHVFDYYDEVRDAGGMYHGFDTATDWNTGTDSLQENLIGNKAVSALGGSLTTGGDFRMYIGFNIEDPLKDGSFGGSFVIKGGATEGKAEMLDINGDNLPDKVFRDGDHISFRLNTSGPNGTTTFGPKHAVGDLNSLSKESYFSAAGGPEVYFGITAQLSIGINISIGESYFIDVNFDGLPDFVDNGKVYFSHLAAVGGEILPAYEESSAHTSVPIDAGAATLPTLQQITDLEAKEKAKSPLVDTVRRWIAPWTGHVNISGDVTFSPVLATGETYTSDGVRAAIQAAGSELWADVLSSSDVKTPTGVTGISVSRGQAIYFRLQSVDDGVKDRVLWDPSIAYTDVTDTTDVNGLSQTQFSGSADFTLAGRPGTIVIMPLDGHVSFSASVKKTAVTSDDVTVLVLHNGTPVINQTIARDTVSAAGIPIAGDFDVAAPATGTATGGTTTTLEDTTRTWTANQWAGAIVTISAGTNSGKKGRVLSNTATVLTFDAAFPSAIDNTSVYSMQDVIEAKLSVDSPIDITKLSWAPDLHYTSATSTDPNTHITTPVPTTDPVTGKNTLGLTVPTDTDIYPSDNLSAPQQAWTSNLGRTVDVEANVGLNLLNAEHPAADVVLTVKGSDGSLAKKIFTVPQNAVSATTTLSVDLTNGTQYWFDLSVRDPVLSDEITSSSIQVKYNDGTAHTVDVPNALHAAGRQGVFPIAYRGWAYAGYNGDGTKATQPIVETAFVFNKNDYNNGGVPPDVNDPNYKDPTQGKVYAFTPTVRNAGTNPVSVWQGPKDSIYGGAGDAQSSRLKNDSVHLVSAGGSGQRAVRRLAITPSIAGTVGVGPLTASGGTGTSDALLDYVDLNGDAFPDVVAPGYVNFTGPRGGYVSTGDGSGQLGVVGNDTTASYGGGFGGSAVEVKSNSKGDGNTAQGVAAVSGKGNRPSGGSSASKGEAAEGDETGVKVGFSVGLNGSVSNNEGQGEQELADVNGDGLPDRIRVSGSDMFVRFNTGYGFTGVEFKWAGSSRFENGETVGGSLGVSLGFNIGDLEFAGGLSLTESYDAMHTTWVDVNGDGIIDRLRKDGSVVRVGFGTGSGILPEVVFGAMSQDSVGNPVLSSFGLLQGDQIASGHDVGLGVAVDFTIGIGPLCIPTPLCYIILNPGGDFERSLATQQVELRDVDGDGYPDSVKSTADDKLTVRRNLTGRTNLLKSVKNPLGGTTTIGYDRHGNTVDQPYSQWAMTRVVVDDGRPGDGVNQQLSTYTYDGSVFNPLERAQFGYRKITEKQRDPGAGEPVLKVLERTYSNGNIFESGLLTRETLFDGTGTKKVKETVNDWTLVDLSTNAPALLQPTVADPANVRLLTMAVAPERTKTEQRWFDAAGLQQKNTWTTYAYDDLANVIQAIDVGEPGAAFTADDLVMTITYSDCTISSSDGLRNPTDGEHAGLQGFPCPAPAPSGPVSPFYNVNRCPTWTSLPARIEVRDALGNLLRKRDGAPALCDNSSVTHLEETTGTGPSAPPPAVTLLSYDDWGSYNHIEYPENATGQRYTVDYVYDVINRANVGEVTDSHGLSATATFDGPTGRIASRTDANGQLTTYTYDAAGRTASITLPPEQGSGHPTVSYEYHPDATPAPTGYSYAIAHNFDAFHPADTIDTVGFVDGIGRQTETKQDATFFRGTATPADAGMAVSGAVEFDALGRPIKQWYPIEEPLGQIGTYNYNTSPIPTETTYNVADLVTKVKHPDGSATTSDHIFATTTRFGPSETLFLTHQVDEEGKPQDTYSNVRDNVLGVELLPGSTKAALTKYQYDAIGQVTRVVPPVGNATTHIYDLLGRHTSTNTPDGGLVTFGYDGASNLTEKVTPNLRTLSQKISYGYDFDNLISIDYPGATPAVHYTYGGPGAAANGAGRVIRVQDGARDQSLSYGSLGDVVLETEIEQLHNLSDATLTKYTFTTSFDADSFGRLKTVTYPDGEVVSYDYDSGGLVSKASGVKTGIAYPYVDRLEYDAFLNRRFLRTGNGVETETAYNDKTRRVERIRTFTPFRKVQDLFYTYDLVGNVKQQDNTVPLPPADNVQGGPSTQKYTYDDFYRVSSATGTYNFGTGKTRKYAYQVGYDNRGNVTSKKQTDTIFQASGSSTSQVKTTYDIKSIEFGGPAPHQITKIGVRPYTHDLDGNFTGWTDPKTGQNRSVTWDAEDRMRTIADQGSTTTHTYDESGRLAIDRGPQGEKAYVNQWYTVLSGSVGWKDIWAGDERIATKRVFTDGLPEFQRFFIHKDLQGDMHIVTDAAGLVYEHLEYLPAGEIWVVENSDLYHTPFTLAGAYYDEVRAVLDFGARWYEPREQYMFGTDPALVDSPEAAIGDPFLLNPYTYAEDNALRLVDRDGRVPEDVQNAWRAAFGGRASDIAKANAFSALAAKRFTDSRSGKLATALGRIAADPLRSTGKGIKGLVERFGSKPLLGIKLERTKAGFQLKEVSFSPTLGFKEFTKKFGAKNAAKKSSSAAASSLAIVPAGGAPASVPATSNAVVPSGGKAAAGGPGGSFLSRGAAIYGRATVQQGSRAIVPK